MMGPETRNDVSAGSTEGGTLEAGEVDAAALETAEAAGSVPPHPPARRATAKANNAIRLRILFLHRNTSPANTTLSNGAVGVGDCDSGIKSRRVLDKLRFGTDDHYAAVKRARRIAVQLHDRLLPLFQQASVAVINRQIDGGLRRVYNLGEGITQLQLASGEILNVRSRYYAIDWRT